MATRHLRRWIGVLVASLVVAMSVSASPASACDTIADAQYWSDNCLTDWRHYRVSDLTSGIQLLMVYDNRPGWVSSVDGVYGTSSGGGATPAAVRDFQTWAGLDDDGKTGWRTWGALDNAFFFEGTTPNYKYFDIIGSGYIGRDRMVVKKSNRQAYIRKPNGYWVRVDAWRSTGTTTWPY